LRYRIYHIARCGLTVPGQRVDDLFLAGHAHRVPSHGTSTIAQHLDVA
jgi:hypothetical protein